MRAPARGSEGCCRRSDSPSGWPKASGRMSRWAITRFLDTACLYYSECWSYFLLVAERPMHCLISMGMAASMRMTVLLVTQRSTREQQIFPVTASIKIVMG